MIPHKQRARTAPARQQASELADPSE